MLEQSLLGCLLIDSSIIEPFFETGLLEFFYDSANRVIAKAIFSLAIEWSEVDLITVKTYLEKENKLEYIGWMTYLVELTEIVPTTHNWKDYSISLLWLYSL